MREVIRSDMDYISRGDFLEIQDLDTPASSSSSSENSSRVSFTSDEYFDPMALLRDIDRDNNFDTVQRDAACIRSSAPIRLRTEVVHQGGSGLSIHSKLFSSSCCLPSIFRTRYESRIIWLEFEGRTEHSAN